MENRGKRIGHNIQGDVQKRIIEEKSKKEIKPRLLRGLLSIGVLETVSTNSQRIF